MMKWFCMAVLALQLVSAAEAVKTETLPDEVIPAKDLAVMLKENRRELGAAREWMIGLSDAEKRELYALYTADRTKAAAMILEKVAAKREFRKQLEQEIKSVSAEYLKTSDPAVQQQLKKRLHELLTKRYEFRLKEIRCQLKLQEKRLADIRRLYEKQQTGAADEVQKQLDRMTRQNRPRGAKKK